MMLMHLIRADKESAKYGVPSLREIVVTTIRNREGCYWHKDGAIEAATMAAEAVQDQGIEAVIDAIEREITRHEFICNFDDPCDKWIA